MSGRLMLARPAAQGARCFIIAMLSHGGLSLHKFGLNKTSLTREEPLVRLTTEICCFARRCASAFTRISVFESPMDRHSVHGRSLSHSGCSTQSLIDGDFEWSPPVVSSGSKFQP